MAKPTTSGEHEPLFNSKDQPANYGRTAIGGGDYEEERQRKVRTDVCVRHYTV